MGYNGRMTTINTIEELARILREQPTWAEALRSLVLSEDLLDLPARFDRFVEAQGEVNASLRQSVEALQASNARLERFVEELQASNARLERFVEELQASNARLERVVEELQVSNARLEQSVEELREFVREQQETNRLVNQRLNNMEGRLGNLEGREYERSTRSKALSRSVAVLGFNGPYVALNQDGHTDPRFVRAFALAVNQGAVGRERSSDLFEADVVVSNEDNRHAVFEISITADNDDIHRAKARAEILAQITGGEVTPAVITANLRGPQREQAEAENVTVFVVPYP